MSDVVAAADRERHRTETVQVEVSPTLWEHATEVANRHGHSISEVIAWALERYVSREQR